MNMYNVTFAGDYFILTTTVIADSEDMAEKNGREMIMSYYGWDMTPFTVEAELEGVFQ